MARKGIFFGIASAIALTALTIASAMEVKVGGLVITDQNIRATVPTAKVAAGYLTIKNTGDQADTLLGGTVDFAKMVDVHEMKVQNGVMTMRPLDGGLIIPPGGEVVLKSGAEHLMFMQLSEPMTEGETRIVTLEFEKAGKVEVMFPVGSLGGADSNHSGHSHGSSD